METVFRINASKLDKKFLNVIRSLFRKGEIEITVSDVVNDETDLLLKDSKNKSHLMNAIEEVKQNKNLVHFSGEEFQNYSKSLLKK